MFEIIKALPYRENPQLEGERKLSSKDSLPIIITLVAMRVFSHFVIASLEDRGKRVLEWHTYTVFLATLFFASSVSFFSFIPYYCTRSYFSDLEKFIKGDMVPTKNLAEISPERVKKWSKVMNIYSLYSQTMMVLALGCSALCCLGQPLSKQSSNYSLPLHAYFLSVSVALPFGVYFALVRSASIGHVAIEKVKTSMLCTK